MRNMIPIKQLGRHRKAIAVVVVIIVLYEVQMGFLRSPPVTEDVQESVQIDRTLPENIIPNLRKLLKIDKQAPPSSTVSKCASDIETAKHEKPLAYKPNIRRTNFSTTEQILFHELRKKVRDATREANELLQDTMSTDDDGDDRDQETPAGGGDTYARLGDARLNKLIAKQMKKRRRLKDNGLGVNFGSHVYYPGGHWIPTTCQPKWKVAIIIPYRNRLENLNTLLRNLVPFLLNQDLEFGIFIAEQGNSEVMNRGLMRNIGYQLARHSGTDWDCYIFHDVDYVPMNATNYYGCDNFPKHYAINLEEFNYSNPFVTDFGGVVGLTRRQLEKINGYSNMYWGWGGEDDDVVFRLRVNRFNISRSKLGYYRNLPHEKKTKNETCMDRFCLLKFARRRMRTDGLTAIRYPTGANFSLSTLYTNISVDVAKSVWNYYPICNRSARHPDGFLFAVISVICVAGLMFLLFCCVILSASVPMEPGQSSGAGAERYGDDSEEDGELTRVKNYVEYGESLDEDTAKLLKAVLKRYEL